jgi:hypothetical protein
MKSLQPFLGAFEAMTEYRINIRDEIGQVVDSLGFVCADDADAMAIVERRLRPGTCAEIWRCAGYIGVVGRPAADPLYTDPSLAWRNWAPIAASGPQPPLPASGAIW